MTFTNTAPDLVGCDGAPLDISLRDLTLQNATAINVVSSSVMANQDHRAMMRAAARLIELHTVGFVNLAVEPELAVIVDAGFRLVSNYDMRDGHAA